ncbi:hypothetical protein [Flexivirga oryzae]|uniref:Uncharacterized protein n=1 Tax=Flexivirga oryzae TaxID=1794944 RepID=A0A839NBH8_9MICO|nr:hypothetical protein [Flexivirga oryzae]MBB2894567.1 hypothetical protein [Flexivirga oryzae]
MSVGILEKTYQQVKTESIDYIDGAIPPRPLPLVTIDQDEPAYLPKIRADWATAKTALAAIDQVMSDMANALATEQATNSQYTPQAQQTRKASILASYTAQLTAQRTTASRVLQQMVTTAADAALPPRPQPEDVVQLARIAGLKEDLQMLLANCTEPDQFVGKIRDYLTDALANDDALTTWFVAGGGWLSLWIRSHYDGHEATYAQASLDQAIGAVLDQHATQGGLGEARALYRKLADPQRGCTSLLTLLGGFFTQVVDDLTSWP